MSRWKASAIHLLLSVLVGGGLLALFLGLWYPQPLFSASGGDRLIGLIIGIDVIAGPLLTLIVFRSGKPSLRFDLACIVTAQLAFLAYGVSTAIQARPAYLVYATDRFVVVPANALDSTDLAQALPEFRKLPWLGPELIALQLPPGQAEQMELLHSAMQGKDAERYPKYYRAYETRINEVFGRAHSLRLLKDLPEELHLELEGYRQLHPELGFYPLLARNRSLTILIDLDAGYPVGIIDFDPWATIAGPAPPVATPNAEDLMRVLGGQSSDPPSPEDPAD